MRRSSDLHLATARLHVFVSDFRLRWNEMSGKDGVTGAAQNVKYLRVTMSSLWPMVEGYGNYIPSLQHGN